MAQRSNALHDHTLDDGIEGFRDQTNDEALTKVNNRTALLRLQAWCTFLQWHYFALHNAGEPGHAVFRSDSLEKLSAIILKVSSSHSCSTSNMDWTSSASMKAATSDCLPHINAYSRICPPSSKCRSNVSRYSLNADFWPCKSYARIFSHCMHTWLWYDTCRKAQTYFYTGKHTIWLRPLDLYVFHPYSAMYT
jgi:hypothetical protein